MAEGRFLRALMTRVLIMMRLQMLHLDPRARELLERPFESVIVPSS
jgi:hypothetical protein